MTRLPPTIPFDPAGSRVDDWRFAVSVYGPAFTLASYPLGLVGVSAALWILKGVSALAVLAICALLARVAAVRGVRPATAVAFVGLNPLVLVHVVGGAYNDALMTLGVVAGIAAALAGREALAGAASSQRRRSRSRGPCRRRSPPRSPRRSRLLAGGIAAAVVIGSATLVAFGPEAAEALGHRAETRRRRATGASRARSQD